VNGRKRHIVVDTLGMLHGVSVHPADIQDRDGAKLVLSDLPRRLRVVFADSAYGGQLVEWFRTKMRRALEVVRRTSSKGFHILPKRWIVERTFAWLGNYRRHSKDYEELTDNSEAMIQISMIRLMTKRLARNGAAKT